MILDLPQCEARCAIGGKMLCRHPRVRAPGNVVSAIICQGCDHINEPADMKPVRQVEAEFQAEMSRAASEPRPTVELVTYPPEPCIHRGLDILRQERSQLCGTCNATQAVFACAIHGECTLRRYKSGSKPACCRFCPDADPGKPAPRPPARLAQITFGITAFERPRHLERLVASIQKFYPDARIVVADNGRQKAKLPASVRLLDLPFDCGLSAARNALVDQLETPYLLVLEEDFVFTAETRIEPFVDVLESHREVGLVSGSLVNNGNRQEHAVDFHVFNGIFHETKSSGPIRVTDRGTPYRLCDKAYNFFLVRREMLADHRWRDALKVGEHTAFFWDVRQAGKWLVAQCPTVAAVHDQSGRSTDYQSHRLRAVGYMSRWRHGAHIKGFEQERRVRNDAPSIERPNVLVYGVGHSGTSVLTRMFGAMGWNMPGADVEFAEHVGIRQINQQLLAGKTFTRKTLADKLRQLPEPWVIKDPRFHRTLETWLPALSDLERPPVLLWIQRDQAAMVGSYARRKNAYADTPEKLAKAVQRAQAGFDSWPWAKITLHYEQLAAAASIFHSNPAVGTQSDELTKACTATITFPIPRVLHWIWIGDQPLPDRHIQWMRQWKILHPHWQHKLWSQADILAVLPDRWRRFYDLAQTFAGKADIARYWIVYEHGGVYLDTDRSCLKSIDELLVGCQCFLSYATPAGIVTNNIFGAVPKHPFLARVLERFPQCFDAAKPNKSGPLLFTELAKGRGDVRIFERQVLDPVADGDRHLLEQMADFPGSYSVHYYQASWVREKRRSMNDERTTDN
jgi:hypothetical protein